MTAGKPQRASTRSTMSKPSAGQVAAAKLIIKRSKEGKGRVEITPRIKYLASYGE